MFRYSLRTLFIGITIITVLLVVGLRWLRTTEELTLEYAFGNIVPQELELIEPGKKEAAEISRRRVETRKWMEDQHFGLDESVGNVDRFAGIISNFGRVQVVTDYAFDTYSCKATYEWGHWIWEGPESFAIRPKTDALDKFMENVGQVAARDYYLEDSAPPLPRPCLSSKKLDSP